LIRNARPVRRFGELAGTRCCLNIRANPCNEPDWQAVADLALALIEQDARASASGSLEQVDKPFPKVERHQ